MKIVEFLRKLRQILEEGSDRNVLPFFDRLFCEPFIQKISAAPGIPETWQKLDLVAAGGDWNFLYQVAAEVLRDAAMRQHSEAHPEAFQEATVISFAFCTTVWKEFNIEIEPVQIVSPRDEMLKQGLLKVTKGPDGKNYVELTEEGEQAAREFEAELDKR